ncbi:uncharacterized protein METZ01_LOCUS326359, partial [marine metagenome]
SLTLSTVVLFNKSDITNIFISFFEYTA